MLSYALAIAVAFSSLVLFSTAFLMSDIHRQDDFLWSGVGLFYALVLWFCARNITGAVLLGQAAATTLLVSYSWQTLKLRKAVANPEQATEINNFSLLKAANGLLNRQKVKSQPETVLSQTPVPEKVTDKAIAIPKAVATASPAKNSNKTKFGRFGRFFGKQDKSNITNTKLDEILAEEVVAKTSKNNENDVIPTVASNKPKTAKSPISKRVEPTQPAKENINDVESPTDSELSTPAVSESVETSKTSINSNIAIPEVVEDNPVVDSIDSASKPQTNKPQTKQKKQPVTVTPKIAVNISDSSVAQEIKPESTNQDLSETDNSQIEKKDPAELNQPKTEEISNNSADIPQSDTPQSDTTVEQSSVLDSLETVEVAEVLEALPEDAANKRNQRQENIIEVTTTEIKEINIATEVTKIDQNQNNDVDFEEKQT